MNIHFCIYYSEAYKQTRLTAMVSLVLILSNMTTPLPPLMEA